MKSNDFGSQLHAYQSRIEPHLQTISQQLLRQTEQEYGDVAAQVVQAYSDVLLRGGKRIRGALAICAYEMFGGSDKQLIEQAAAGLEMLNTYVLLADDIQDRSAQRRGGPTAHVLLADYHSNQHLKGSSEHFGQSLAINALLYGLHESLNIFTDLPTDAQTRLDVIRLINKSFVTTIHGQTLDIYNEYAEHVDMQAADNVLVWKTAHYTFINPLQLGAVLAGARPQDLEQLEQFGVHAGKVFQLADDVTGIFGSQKDLGKSPKDDIKEGKQNTLILKTLELAPAKDASYLRTMLGNQALTNQQFLQCQQIIKNSGALEFVQQQARQASQQAQGYMQPSWTPLQTSFLQSLLSTLEQRCQA